MISPHRTHLRVLVVDDDEDDFLITRDVLEGQDRTRFSVEWCPDYEGALVAVAGGRHDIYLVDYRLGARTGLELARDAFTIQPAVALILLTGQNDVEIDLQAADLGVTDFLLKQELSAVSLERSIRYAVRHQDALRELARSEERYELAARAVNDGIWDWDLRTGEVYYSSRWNALLGGPETATVAGTRAWFDLVHPDDLPRLRSALEAHRSGRSGHLQSEHRVRHADGSWRWLLARGLAIRGPDGVVTRMAGSLSDVTDRRLAQEQLQHHAFYDALTGLPNRALFVDRLEQALLQVNRRPGQRHAVLFVDIDRFKLINDTFSHAVGDHLLQAVAVRLVDAVRAGDTVARLGGDEFTVLLEGLPAIEAENVATELAHRLRAVLAKEFVVDGRRLYVTVSIGVALTDAGSAGDDVLRNADIAMYEAKRRSRDTFVLFDSSMHDRMSERVTTETELRAIVEQGRLDVHYQPVVDLTSGELRGFEALARWPQGTRPVSPAEFIPIAEEIGMIRPLGLHVLRTALEQLASWRRQGAVAGDVTMSINVSARQLDDPAFADDVLATISATTVPASLVRLEITESTLMREPERMAPIVSQLCSTGLGLELDDFGTGYSSLTALHQFPVSALKVDRSFVTALTRGASSDPIVRSTVALAHSLGLGVVAEGIEEVEQLQRLRALGCEYGQGYLFAPPLDAATVAGLLDRLAWQGTIDLAEAAPRVQIAHGRRS